MIAYLRHGQIDKTRWDDCIAHASNALIYARSWYLDVVHEGWEALVEVIDGNYQSVMPLTCNRKYGVNYLFQPFFTQQLGVFSRSPLTEEKVMAFLKAIPKKFLRVEIRLNEGNSLPEGCRGVEFHRNCLLDLRQSYELLSSHYHENTKRNLKRSLKYNLRLVKGIPVAKVVELFRHDRGASVKHWGDREYARLERLVDVVTASQKALVYGIQNSDNYEIICGAILLKYQDRITFLFSGNSGAGKSCQAMTFLLDQVIREFACNMRWLDFEGSDDSDLARYYLGFGAEEKKYPSFTKKIL